jgi:hypothetical protein
MSIRDAMGAIMLAAALALPAVAQAFDESKYPDMQAQWSRPRGVGIQWDPSKPGGRPQQPPLTAEYQAIWEASMADQANGGQGNDPLYRCFPVGMPRVMNAVFPMEIVINPNTTYILFDSSTPRRIFTDGRATGPRTRSRIFSATPSASGSTRTATDASTRSRSRRAS